MFNDFDQVQTKSAETFPIAPLAHGGMEPKKLGLSKARLAQADRWWLLRLSANFRYLAPVTFRM